MATATRTAKASIFLMSEKNNNNNDNNFARAAQFFFFCTFLGRCFSRLQRKTIIKLPSLYNARFLLINRHMLTFLKQSIYLRSRM